jgi:hypothetical protein
MLGIQLNTNLALTATNGMQPSAIASGTSSNLGTLAPETGDLVSRQSRTSTTCQSKLLVTTMQMTATLTASKKSTSRTKCIKQCFHPY